MQAITISGYLSRDAENTKTQAGESICRWNVPVRQGFGDKEKTNWFRVSIWGKRAEYAGKARKGEFAVITGDLTIGDYQGKPQYEIRASDFSFVRTAPRDDTAGQSNNSQANTQSGDWPDDLDDDIQF